MSVYLHNHSICLPREAQNREGSCRQAGVGLGNGLTSADLARLPSAAASSARCRSDSRDSGCFLATALFGGTVSAKGEAGLEVCARQAAPLINPQGPPGRLAPSRQQLPPGQRGPGWKPATRPSATSQVSGQRPSPKACREGPGHPPWPPGKAQWPSVVLLTIQAADET